MDLRMDKKYCVLCTVPVKTDLAVSMENLFVWRQTLHNSQTTVLVTEQLLSSSIFKSRQPHSKEQI